MTHETSALLGAVLSALEEERQALESRDAAALSEAVRAKIAAVDHLRQLASAGSGDGESLQVELRALLARCRELNEHNGLLIRGQRRKVEASLNLLRTGRTAPDVYGRDGETQTVHLARTTLASF